jgi:hypothetical protein
MRITYGLPATIYGPLGFGDEFQRPKGMAMHIESLTESLTTGVLIAGLAISLHIGHCVWFAVDCF